MSEHDSIPYIHDLTDHDLDQIEKIARHAEAERRFQVRVRQLAGEAIFDPRRLWEPEGESG